MQELATLAFVEQRQIALTLEATGGNMTSAAKILGIDRRTLYRKVQVSQPLKSALKSGRGTKPTLP